MEENKILERHTPGRVSLGIKLKRVVWNVMAALLFRPYITPVFRKWRLFQTSDFFVLPTHSENFGLAIAESLASGTPVITTVGTPWSDLNDTNSGAWIEIGTQPLVEALRKFLALSDEELEAMGRNGRRLIEEKYSANVMAREMMEVYDQVTQFQS